MNECVTSTELARTDTPTPAAPAESMSPPVVLERIKMSRDGPPVTFEIPREDGFTEKTPTIFGIILHHRASNTRYAEAYGSGTGRPECHSNDGVRGMGDPGGLCCECVYNRFGSGGGNRKACKNRQLLYLQLLDRPLPLTMLVPANSLRTFSAYRVQQLQDGCFPGRIITKIQLKEAVSASGFLFTQIVFERERVLTTDETTKADQMTVFVRKYDASRK